MQRVIFILAFTLVMAATQPGWSQYTDTPVELAPPEQVISLNSGLDIGIALDMLSEYSTRFAGKPIHDPTKQSGAIGIEITGMPWEKALQTILARRGLWYENRDYFLQVVVPATGKTSKDKESPYGDAINYKPGSREIKIETIFFEGDRKALTQIGIDWSTFYNGKVSIASAQTGSASMDEELFSLSLAIPKKLYNVDIRALFKLFDSKNIGRVIAQPQVVVTEGNEGKIQVGQDFSIKTRDFAGNMMDRFYSTGTILQVMPFIIPDAEKGDVILLKAHVEKSQAYPDVVSTIIKKSEANSLVQLFDGEETLIAGLYSTEKIALRKGLPLVKDLPWYVLGLRYLFGYNRFEDLQKELIIIIKASILPEVYARRGLEMGKKSARSTLEQRLQQYRFQESENDSIDLEGMKSTSDAGIPGKSVVNPQNKKTETKPKGNIETEPARNDLRNGVVQNVQNEFILIDWGEGANPDRLVNRTATIVRMNGNGFESVGKVQIVRAKAQKTVARLIAALGEENIPVKSGDRAVIKWSE